jgi:hypothetical protein
MVKRAFNVSVQCPHDADARHHGRTAEFDDQEQRFYRGLHGTVLWQSAHVADSLSFVASSTVDWI